MSEHRLFYLMHTAHHAMFKQAEKQCMTHLNVSCVQLSALFYLQKNDGCLLKELSAGLSLNNSAITGLVSRMISSDLLVKKSCEQDARAFRIFLTQKAKEILPEGFSLLKQFNQDIAAQFSNDEIEIVAKFLHLMAKMD